MSVVIRKLVEYIIRLFDVICFKLPTVRYYLMVALSSVSTETRNNNDETSKSIIRSVDTGFAEKQKGMPIVASRENPCPW